MKTNKKTFAEKVIYLDCALTGARFKDALRTWGAQGFTDPIQFFTDRNIYYLSDGGYSRIVVNCSDEKKPESVKVFLASGATAKVQEGWGRSKELIADLENLLGAALKMEWEKEQEDEG